MNALTRLKLYETRMEAASRHLKAQLKQVEELNSAISRLVESDRIALPESSSEIERVCSEVDSFFLANPQLYERACMEYARSAIEFVTNAAATSMQDFSQKRISEAEARVVRKALGEVLDDTEGLIEEIKRFRRKD